MRYLLFLFLCCVTSLAAQTPAEEEIRATFEGYRSAILNDKGEEAVEFLDRRNFEYYGEILNHVLHSDSAAIAELSFMDRFMTLRLRVGTPIKELRLFTDTTILVYAIDEGMIGKDETSNTSLGSITVTDDFATAVIKVGEESAPFNFHFYRESGHWGLDLTTTFAFADVALRQAAVDSGMGEEEFMIFLIEFVTSKTVDRDQLWRPVNSIER